MLPVPFALSKAYGQLASCPFSMNYQKLYDSIMATGRQRGTKERPGFDLHHVIPSCMDGSDYESNKALLTYREHFVAHRILTKIHLNHSGLHCAVWRMTNNGKHKKSGRTYEKARQNFIDNHPSKTPENRKARRKAWEGSGNPGKKPENRKAISERNKLPDHKKVASKQLGQQAKCPHCLLIGQSFVMSRWHFDNCLQHTDNFGLTRQQIKARRNRL